MRTRLALTVWTGLIILAVVPWWSFQNHSHWTWVQWVPFVTPPQKIRDWVVNVAMYVPFGYLCGRMCARRGRAWLALILALLLSVATESTQLYSHRRFPSTTDVICNLCGAYVGVRWALKRERSVTWGTEELTPLERG